MPMKKQLDDDTQMTCLSVHVTWLVDVADFAADVILLAHVRSAAAFILDSGNAAIICLLSKANASPGSKDVTSRHQLRPRKAGGVAKNFHG